MPSPCRSVRRTAPTSHDVARAAGVSQPTVSRALRDDPRVTAATRERVLAAARALGYVASDRGRSLSTRRTRRVGVVVEDLDNPFYLELLDDLHEPLDAPALRMIVFTPRPDDPGRLERLVDGSIDGVVLTTTLLDSPLPARLCATAGFPFVLLNRDRRRGCVPLVLGRQRRGGAVAAALVAGHREIAAIFGPARDEHGPRSRARLRRARRARASRSDRPTRRGPFAYETGHAALLRAARRAPTADRAVLRQRRHRARRAERGHALGVRVPEDAHRRRLRRHRHGRMGRVRLSTVRQDVGAGPPIAVDLLLARITKPDRPPQQHVLHARLVRRATLARAPN